MKNRLLPFIIILILISSIVSCAVLWNRKEPSVDTVRLNDIRASVENNNQDYSKVNSNGLDIIIIGLDGSVKYPKNETVNKSYDEWLNYAYQNDCVILEFSEGRIFVFKPEDSATKTIVVIVAVFSAVLVTMLGVYWLYIEKNIFYPFKRLKSFAGEVAAGKLDSPMLMDKNNVFGAFTESFDIMREELQKAKEKEIALEKSKKELVAQLSHDIKTPIASIKAVSEVLRIGEENVKKLNNLEIIQRKSNEIDNLITDMFNVTLQDLSEFKIKTGEVSSRDIKCMIKEADYLNRIYHILKIPECLVFTDKQRLQQIIGNIINNSYKYAETEIEVIAAISEKALEIEFRDFGSGVSDEELSLITNKFYRGKNMEGRSGAGLGLYICKAILDRTDGMIDCYNTKDGFAVKISLKLA